MKSNNDAAQTELKDTVIEIKRVAKVIKGGRTIRFTALVAVGDGKGRVGVGLGKSLDIPEAVRKGREDAVKNIITVPVNEEGSIPHDYTGKFGATRVLMKKSPEGTGVIAGGPVRAICDVAGIRNIRTKCMGSKNKNNVVLATMNGLKSLKVPEEVAAKRGKTLEELRA